MAQTIRVGLVSRIDYGSPGFRQGLLELAFDRFREAKVHFVICVGGLLSWKHLKTAMPRKADAQDAFITDLIEKLAKSLPRVGRNSDVKTYLMISPAYDGRIGETVARRLAELRSDIRFYPKPSERFGRNCKRIAALVPTKASWRSRYASTPVDGLLGEELRRSTQPVADVYVVGCYGVFVHRPKGESPCEYIAVPALHKLEEVTSAENQVGAVILEVNDVVRTTNYNFKDEVSNERKLISVPTGLTTFEEMVFAQLQAGPKTPGMIEEALREDRAKVDKALKKLTGIKRRNYPHLCCDENSGRYDFDNEWLREHLRYPWDANGFKEDTLQSFACMHAGSVNTDYQYVTGRMADLALAQGVTCVAGVGDFIEGLKHDLMLMGEVIANMNYTRQSQLAAKLIARYLLRVFTARLEEALKKSKPSTIAEVEKLVLTCLLPFYATQGNHDQWPKSLGFDPLTLFLKILIEKLSSEIYATLEKNNVIVPPNLVKLVKSRIIPTDDSQNVCVLPSTLKIGFKHPHQGRAQTTTLRLQASLAAMRGCQVVAIGNFHTASFMTQWDPELGQRVGIQCGTLKHSSEFEDNLNKVVDFGSVCVQIWSRNGRVVATQSTFDSEKQGKRFSNDDLLDAIEKDLGVY